MSIKTIIFAKNVAGINSIQINMADWTIKRGCASLPPLMGRHCRLTDRGNKVEYRDGSGYRVIPAQIKEIV